VKKSLDPLARIALVCALFWIGVVALVLLLGR
jgi:hypothetical protein